MSNLNNALEPKCTKRQADIGKITNMLDSSEMPVVSPPRPRATRISSSPGVPEKNTNIVNSVQFATTIPTESRKLSDGLLIPSEIPANVNANGKPVDGDDGIQCENDSNNEDELVEELRHLGKQQMAEMLQNKRRLEEKLEMMTQKHANKKPG